LGTTLADCASNGVIAAVIVPRAIIVTITPKTNSLFIDLKDG
jgi:hypothetical protein